MGIIHVLDKSVAELIAAGEVVERPSSAIKELVENAIDAGATAITVEIQKGGMSFMRVTDNGCGFYPEDVKNAFLRHATSKVRSAGDLDAISTMGFRGEALASISAVARVELLSRREDAVEGIRYAIDASEEVAYEAAGCPVGTTIVVRDLFYNTPARLKFLKKDVSEANAVAGIVEKIALVYPEISFRLIRDGEEKLHTPGDGQQLSAIYAIFGREFAAGLLPVDYTMNGFSLKGFVSKPHKARANRSMQNFYVNRRYVKSRTCAVALEEGFKHSMMVGRFPACVLDVHLPPHSVDVNVHPAKIEVRFENEKPIFDLVYFGVKNALQAGDITVEGSLEKPRQKPVQQRMSAEEFRSAFGGEEKEKTADPALMHTAAGAGSTREKVGQQQPPFPGRALEDSSGKWLSFDTGIPSQKPADNLPFEKKVYSPDLWGKNLSLDVEVEDALLPNRQKGGPEEMDAAGAAILPDQAIASPAATAQSLEQQEFLPPSQAYEDLAYLGELFHTYILFEGKARLVLVDKHAAHERILYNQLKAGKTEQFMQNLLSPVAVLLSQEEYSAALEHLDVLLECGFEAEDFGGGSLLVRSAPMWLENAQIEETVNEICGYLSQGKQDVSPEHLDWLYHNISCRAAVKGGDRSTPEELQEILRLMREDGTVFHCPHGRPVAVILTKKEIEKQFGRI
ncbi:MAG: DNA mismatch repair endonuclease MutL [Oscillospiraceae bacterium]|nr:DNA mismatch repair endonuclease MutL [Oscillospiraceae bacterium]